MALAWVVYCMPGYLLLPRYLHDNPHFSCAKFQSKEEGDSRSGGTQVVVAPEMTDGILVECHLFRATDQYM